MFKIQKQTSYTTIPNTAFVDDSISLAAKGLYALLFSQKVDSIDELVDISYESKEDVEKVLQELIVAGYIQTAKHNYKVLIHKTSKPTMEAPMPVPKDNKFIQIMSMVNNYTEDEELRKALSDYFMARNHPRSDSRFITGGDISLYQVEALLKQLDTLKGDKVEIVKYCLEKQYFKFFDLPKKKGIDGVSSNTYTIEEIENIKRRAMEMEAQGQQGIY